MPPTASLTKQQPTASIEPSGSRGQSDFIGLSLPPMSKKDLAAHLRMASDPHFLAGYEPGTWVALSGETIVAAGKDLAQVIRTAEQAGELDPLLVPIMPDEFIG
jgi:hypothetical protein